MPSFVYKLTITTSGKHCETETTTEIFSTLLSANRAAYMHHQRYEEYYEGDLNSVDDVKWDVPYRANFQEDKYTEIDIDVKRVKISGPDLSRGEVDEKHSSWKVKAGLNKGNGEDDDDDDEADSSEVEIVEPPPAKRVKLNAKNPKEN